MKILLLLIVFTSVRGIILNCKKAFPAEVLSNRYNETIAHAIHSMTVEGLRLFSDKASSKNFVPTVNQDLSGSQLVLDHAPPSPVGNDFQTMTMNIIDNVLSTLGNERDGLGQNWSPVERIAHVFHMWDLWYKIKTDAMPVVLNDPPSDDMCECLTTVQLNGIKTAVSWVADHYKTGTPITLLNRPIPKLVDAGSWQVWKQRLIHYYTPEALRDAATYIHCVTKLW